MSSSPSIHDVNAERAERIAIVIQNRIFSNQSPFVEKMENVFWTHFARNEAQVHQLTVTTDAARLHSTQGCASEALMPGRRPWLCGPGPGHSRFFLVFRPFFIQHVERSTRYLKIPHA